MIDIHSHILLNTDDGAKEKEMSLDMARLYIENGYREVIATPHWIEYGGTPKRDRVVEVLSASMGKGTKASLQGIDRVSCSKSSFINNLNNISFFISVD